MVPALEVACNSLAANGFAARVAGRIIIIAIVVIVSGPA